MAGIEDVELRDLVVDALEKNGSLAKVRALLRANIFLAFENEHEPQHHNPALDQILASIEGTLALTLVAEFLDFCNLHHSAYVYKAESRQGHAYRYEGRSNLPEYLNREGSGRHEPILVTIIRSTINNHRKKYDSLSPGKEGRKEDDNCTYIVHEDSGSAPSHSDNSSYDKNKLLLRLQLDNSDTDTSTDSLRDKTSSEYIPNLHIQLEPDSEDESKEFHCNVTPKSYMEETQSNFSAHRNHYEPQTSMQNSTYILDGNMHFMNSSNSTSYQEFKPKTSTSKAANGNTDVVDYSTSAKLPEESDKNVTSTLPNVSETEKHSSTESQPKSVISILSNNLSTSQEPSERQSDKTCNYSDDFSPVQESSKISNKNITSHSTDSSIQEEISLNGSDQQGSNETPRLDDTSRSSISLSDVAELIENSVSSPSPRVTQVQASSKSVIGKNPSIDDIEQRLTNLLRTDEEKFKTKSAKNSPDDNSESPIQSLSNVSVIVPSD